MPAKKINNMYYENGSAARKVLPKEQLPRRKTNAVRRPVSRQTAQKRQQAQRRNVIAALALIFSVFIMSMMLTSRYSKINELNLEVQNLINELEIVSSEVATSQIAVDQNTDLKSIEAYAKQQLGMKKADSSQTVYIDTSESINKIQVNHETTFIDKIINYIKGIFF